MSTIPEVLDLLPPTAAPGPDGRLTVGGCALADLAIELGTPLVVVDEEGLRSAARRYVGALRDRHPDADVYFASKALAIPGVTAVFADEGLGCDVASRGELALALAGGMPASRMLLHGNAKTDADLAAGLEAGIGLIVVDSFDDLDRLDRLVTAPQRVLLRVNPGVLAPTHEAMATGHDGSKFGIPGGQVQAAIERIRAHPLLALEGLHAHIGSQLLEVAPFTEAVAALARFGPFATYDLGGGLGVRYTPDEPPAPAIEDYAEALVAAVHEHLGTECRIIVEPGRSLVARAACTVYDVVGVKRGPRTFVAVDGGMGDNLEVALYGQRFAPAILDADREPEVCDVVGHHCETGDRLAADVTLARPGVGDRLVVPVTGAYCLALSNNYNAMGRPAVVLCRDGDARVLVRRETIDDLLARCVLPDP